MCEDSVELLYAIIATVPFDKMLYSGCERRIRFEADILDQVIHVGKSSRHIAGLHVLEVFDSRFSECIFK